MYPLIHKSAGWRRPFQLVSLLEMLQFHPDRFLLIFNRIDAFIKAIPDDTAQLTYDERQMVYDVLHLLDTLTMVHTVCEDAKLTGIDLQARRIMNTISIVPPMPRHCDLRRGFVALQERIYDSLEELVCLQVPSHKASYYNDTKLFGDDVALRFSATYDIEEAGKCFAVGRYTASVFHLMRVLEIGVKAFANGLGVLAAVNSAQRSWGEVLRLTNQEIQQRNKSGDPDWTPEKRSFFENVQSDLSAVKNAWRNTTMHVQNSYDEERAEDIFNSVKGFMRHIAKHLDEAGTFTP